MHQSNESSSSEVGRRTVPTLLYKDSATQRMGMRLLSVDAMDAGRHAWRCVKKNKLCNGRIYTHGDAFLKQTKLHIHEPDYTDCEVKELYSEFKSLAGTSWLLCMWTVEQTDTDSAERISWRSSFSLEETSSSSYQKPTPPTSCLKLRSRGHHIYRVFG